MHNIYDYIIHCTNQHFYLRSGKKYELNESQSYLLLFVFWYKKKKEINPDMLIICFC